MRLQKEFAKLKDLRMQKLQKFHIEIANASIHLLVYVRMYSTVAAIAATR